MVIINGGDCIPKITEHQKTLKRQQLLETAKELFVIHGYNRTSVNDIVGAAKVSKGSFYNYFDSKESLFFEIVHGEDQLISKKGESLITAHGSKALNVYIDHRLRRFFDDENKIRAKYTFEFWSSTTLTPKQIEQLNSRYDLFVSDIRKLLVFGYESGFYIKDFDYDALIQVLIATIDGLIMLDSVLYKPISEEVIEMTISIFNSFLEKRGANNEHKRIK